jgi:hypothetical protein
MPSAARQNIIRSFIGGDVHFPCWISRLLSNRNIRVAQTNNALHCGVQAQLGA